MNVGDILAVTAIDSTGWLLGTNLTNDKTGYFPNGNVILVRYLILHMPEGVL
jgi:hypothetical protein